MNDNKNTAYTILIIISVIGALVILLTGCATRRTITNSTITERIRDTVYLDRVIQYDREVKDTIISDNVIIEYLPDSAGNWLPSKKTVSSGRHIGSASEKSSVVDSEKATVSHNKEQTTKTETKEVKRTSFWWYLACIALGAIAGILALYAGKYFIRR